MSRKDLTDKYGRNKNSTQAINAAIRAEIPGGNEALDALERIRASDERRGTPDTAEALAAIRAVVNAMADEIRKRYAMPPREE